MSKKTSALIPLAAILVILFFIFLYFVSKDFSSNIIFILNHNPYLGPLLLILWRIIGIIIPAIPAGIVSFAAVPIFGWLATYIYTLSGIMIGTSISFFLARKFREPLVGKFVPLAKLHKLEGELSERKRFMAIVAIRLFTVPVMDFSSYAAGMTRISFPKFFLATALASIPDIAIFYFGERLYQTFFGRSVIVAVALLFLIAAGYFIGKRFFFDKNK
ncbi:MAG: VTT domain-containing protein [Patescibacteria group bacterium]